MERYWLWWLWRNGQCYISEARYWGCNISFFKNTFYRLLNISRLLLKKSFCCFTYVHIVNMILNSRSPKKNKTLNCLLLKIYVPSFKRFILKFPIISYFFFRKTFSLRKLKKILDLQTRNLEVILGYLYLHLPPIPKSLTSINFYLLVSIKSVCFSLLPLVLLFLERWKHILFSLHLHF